MTTLNWYDNTHRRSLEQDISADTDLKCALLVVGHSPSISTHQTWADVQGDETSGTGYTSGGEALTTISVSTSGGTTTLDADTVEWSNSTIDAGYAVVYDDTPASDSDKSLLCLVDFEGEESSDDGLFQIDWHNDGIAEINNQ